LILYKILFEKIAQLPVLFLTFRASGLLNFSISREWF
jgi:hypothetical protein